MNATSNLIHNLEHRLALLMGEREAALSELRAIEESISRQPALQAQLAALEVAIAAAQTLLRHDRPDWESKRVKAVRRRVWKSPFKNGELGRTALTVLRENGGWMRTYDVARVMLDRIGHDPDDRVQRERLANSVNAYFVKHRGKLLESRGEFAKEWRVIRLVGKNAENL
jgi:hypothetical protein